MVRQKLFRATRKNTTRILAVALSMTMAGGLVPMGMVSTRQNVRAAEVVNQDDVSLQETGETKETVVEENFDSYSDVSEKKGNVFGSPKLTLSDEGSDGSKALQVLAKSSDSKYVDITGYEILKELYKDYFKVGVASEALSHWGGYNPLNEIGNPAKEALIKQEFNSMTFGNELKPDCNMGYNDESATETNLPFVIDESAKEMLDWAKANNIPVRGHVLVWHSQSWIHLVM